MLSALKDDFKKLKEALPTAVKYIEFNARRESIAQGRIKKCKYPYQQTNLECSKTEVGFVTSS